MSALACVLSPVACAGTHVASATLGGVAAFFSRSLIDSVQWLLSQAAATLMAVGEPRSVASAATPEFDRLLRAAPLLLAIGLSVATLQALRAGSVSRLWSTYLGVLPACVAAVIGAPALARMVLSADDGLTSIATTSSSLGAAHLAVSLNSLAAATPGFGLFLVAGAVVAGTWLLWCELVIRSVVLTVLIALAPVIIPISVIPALRRSAWRLFEVFCVVAFAKVVIAVVLVVGLTEATGTTPLSVLTGAVTLAFATLSPYLLLRLVPVVEHAAIGQFENVRGRVAARASSSRARLSRVGAASPMPSDEEDVEGFGLETWAGEDPVDPGEEFTGERPPAPVGEPTIRRGHVHYTSDHMGPVVGWHWDD